MKTKGMKQKLHDGADMAAELACWTAISVAIVAVGTYYSWRKWRAIKKGSSLPTRPIDF